MKEISLPASSPLTLVTTVAGSSSGPERLLLELHTPTQDVCIRFGDAHTLDACRRALHLLLADTRHLLDDAVASRVLTVRGHSRTPRQLTLF